MARSLALLGAAAAAYATGAAAQLNAYQLTEAYNHKNFFDKFDFFVSNFNGSPEDIDPTHGFVNYTTRAAAEQLGLIATQGSEIFIGVDHARKDPNGRNSVRIESKSTYDGGLIIASFTHFPKPVCGAWPAFWMYGPNWPDNGELDIYEQWNLATTNSITGHTSGGTCKIQQSDITSTVDTSNCDQNAPGQYANQGCSVEEANGQWGKDNGGTCE